MRPLHQASVFSPYIFLNYICFFGFPSFTVDSSGLLEYFGTCIVTDGSLTFSLYLPQVTPAPPGRDGKPVFGPHVGPVHRRRMNAAYSSWKSLPDVISGLDAGHSWAMVSLPFCLSGGIFVRVKNVRPVKTLAPMREGGVGADQTGNQGFISPFSFQVIKYWGTDNKMPGHSNSCQTIGSKLI